MKRYGPEAVINLIKKMGITAKGGWISVMRHFREMGIDYRVVRGTNAQWYQPHRDGGVSDYATSVGQE